MLKDHNVILAIETHFEFTTFELLRLFEECEAEPYEYLGICLDTMNLLTMLEEPVTAIQRILPWVVATHIKDGGLIEDSGGLMTFPTEIGKGVIDLEAIIKLLAVQPVNIHLSIEDHGGDFLLPIYDQKFIAKFPDLTEGEYAGLLGLGKKTRRLVDKGHLAVVKREDWPGVCEERLKRDIQALKDLVRDVSR
jgi:sugar phosphate isomerase/epimerase